MVSFGSAQNMAYAPWCGGCPVALELPNTFRHALPHKSHWSLAHDSDAVQSYLEEVAGELLC